MRLLSLITGLLVLVLAGCSGEATNEELENSSSEMSGDVRIDGSSTVFPITEAIAEEFRAVQPKVKVTVGVSGTGGGFKKFSRGEIDINDASRPIKDKELAACEESAIAFLEIAVAYDGLAVIANPENDWLESITISELKMIWEPAAQENIKRWNQIRPEWPNEEIHLFGPGVASGTYDYFTEVIVGESGSSRGDYTASEDDNVLVQGIATDKYGLGFFGLAYFQENKDRLKLVSVDSGTGPIVPSVESVGNGTYAPLSRPIFIYVNSLAAERPEVQAFVNFYLDNAGLIAEEVGYIPLPADLYTQSKAKFASFSQPAK
jgi:phosphate transport system substrate-binding protein